MDAYRAFITTARADSHLATLRAFIACYADLTEQMTKQKKAWRGPNHKARCQALIGNAKDALEYIEQIGELTADERASLSSAQAVELPGLIDAVERAQRVLEGLVEKLEAVSAD